MNEVMGSILRPFIALCIWSLRTLQLEAGLVIYDQTKDGPNALWTVPEGGIKIVFKRTATDLESRI